MKKMIYLAVLMALAFSFLVPMPTQAAVSKVRFNITNRTGKSFRLTLRGQDTGARYYLTARAGSSSYTVKRDVYDVTFYGCGESHEVELDITGNLDWVIRYNCSDTVTQPGKGKKIPVLQIAP